MALAEKTSRGCGFFGIGGKIVNGEVHLVGVVQMGIGVGGVGLGLFLDGLAMLEALLAATLMSAVLARSIGLSSTGVFNTALVLTTLAGFFFRSITPLAAALMPAASSTSSAFLDGVPFLLAEFSMVSWFLRRKQQQQ
jgi:hypothetical protein